MVAACLQGSTPSLLEALLVEDDDLDADIIATLASMAEDLSIHFTRARSLREAQRMIHEHTYDLYFVDFTLGDGISLRLLTALEKAGARPIVVSNITRGEVEKYRLNGGGLRFLAKGDCSPGALSLLVRDTLFVRDALLPVA